MDDFRYPPEHVNFKCMAIYRDEPVTKRSKPFTILTIECPGCRRFWHLPRDKWPSKKSGKPLGCAGCGTYVPTREWSLLHVPWLGIVA